MNAIERAISEHGQDVVERWMETGRLVETVLPRFHYKGHGGLAFLGNQWCVDWAVFEPGKIRVVYGDRPVDGVTDCLTEMHTKMGRTALEALREAQ